MCENILSKENISFKKLEQICFKIACECYNSGAHNVDEIY